MKLELEHPCMEPFDPAIDMRVLIVCENSTAAAHACAMLQRIGHNCGLDGRFVYQSWNFDVLSIASLQELAGHEAAEADIIIIAVQAVKNLPRNLTEWMTGWIERRQDSGGALVALLGSGSEDKEAAQGFFFQLRELAVMGRMNFFAQIVGHGETTGGNSLTIGSDMGRLGLWEAATIPVLLPEERS